MIENPFGAIPGSLDPIIPGVYGTRDYTYPQNYWIEDETSDTHTILFKKKKKQKIPRHCSMTREDIKLLQASEICLFCILCMIVESWLKSQNGPEMASKVFCKPLAFL